MNSKSRGGKSSELIVAGELIRYGVDVYMPCVDDQAIDLVVRQERNHEVYFYDVQVKSVKGYNRIIGVKSPVSWPGRYILILHYRHEGKPDEFFYLTREQVVRHHLQESVWGDLVFNKAERTLYAHQTLVALAHALRTDEV